MGTPVGILSLEITLDAETLRRERRIGPPDRFEAPALNGVYVLAVDEQSNLGLDRRGHGMPLRKAVRFDCADRHHITPFLHLRTAFDG